MFFNQRKLLQVSVPRYWKAPFGNKTEKLSENIDFKMKNNILEVTQIFPQNLSLISCQKMAKISVL